MGDDNASQETEPKYQRVGEREPATAFGIRLEQQTVAIQQLTRKREAELWKIAWSACRSEASAYVPADNLLEALAALKAEHRRVQELLKIICRRQKRTNE